MFSKGGGEALAESCKIPFLGDSLFSCILIDLV